VIYINSYNAGFQKSIHSGNISIELQEYDVIAALVSNPFWATNIYDAKRILEIIPITTIEEFMIEKSGAFSAMNKLKQESI
jgi:hypothetical protein